MNDIRYRGPLSYRGLRFIALLAMTLSQIAALFLGLRSVAAWAGEDFANRLMGPNEVIVFELLKSLGGITFPLLLISSMSIVVRKSEKILRVMLSSFLLAAITYMFIVFLAEEMIIILIKITPNILKEVENLDKTLGIILGYVIQQKTGGNLIGLLSDKGITPEMIAIMLESLTGQSMSAEQILSFVNDPGSTMGIAEMIVQSLPAILDELGITSEQTMDAIANYITQELVRSHLNVNVFLDLFLCTVFWFFIDWQPKKLTGGKLLLFRCCAVFPMLYLTVGAFLSGMNRVDWVQLSLPLWLVGLLPSRKLPGILLFLAMTLYIKYREAEEFRRGGNADTFRNFLQTNRNSLHFALFMCAILILLSGADWLFGQIDSTRLSSWGIGISTTMYLAIPFVLLFSYNREPRFRILNAFVPVYYVLSFFLIFLIVLTMIYVAPQFLNGVPFDAIE